MAEEARAVARIMQKKLQPIQYYMEKHHVKPHQIIRRTNRCQTKDVIKLCINNVYQKSKQDLLYYLGSTYLGDEEHLWFYMRIIPDKEGGFILNLNVIHKKVDLLNICATFRDTYSTTLKSDLPGESYHLKTIKLSVEDMKCLRDNSLYIPLTIEMSYQNIEERRARIKEVVEAARRSREEFVRRFVANNSTSTGRHNMGHSNPNMKFDSEA